MNVSTTSISDFNKRLRQLSYQFQEQQYSKEEYRQRRHQLFDELVDKAPESAAAPPSLLTQGGPVRQAPSLSVLHEQVEPSGWRPYQRALWLAFFGAILIASMLVFSYWLGRYQGHKDPSTAEVALPR